MVCRFFLKVPLTDSEEICYISPMQSQISIIIPVYNVEKYLAECLDSVVNQTMHDIQIICVNDGSPDGSRAILQEYADRDSRIEIIDKPNGGLSSARNAAYPHIRGKYTLFVDSDDWIELNLCEKTYRNAEESNAPVTMFFYHEEGGRALHRKKITPDVKTTVEEKSTLVGFPTAWSKLWRTDFLLGNKLYFPEGLIFEDVLVHWKALVFAERIVVLPEYLYHYRDNDRGIMQNYGKKCFDIISIYAGIRRFLEKNRYYPLYKGLYHKRKLERIRSFYERCPVEWQGEFRDLIRKDLTDEDREYYRTGKVKQCVARFYKMEIDGGPVAHRVYQTLLAINRFVKSVKKAA